MNRGLGVFFACTATVLMVPTTAFADSSSSNPVTSQAHFAVRSTSSSAPIYSYIQSGDTLWSLAGKYGVTVAQLETWNSLRDSSTIHPGQRLVVGFHAGSAAAAPARRLAGRSEDAPAGLADAVFGEQLVSYAKQFQGTPYQWGGTSPSGFDCSGFVLFTCSHFGIKLGRTSYDQYQAGTAVSKSSLVPGDLVFFDSYGAGASHVGIYVGGGSFIHASSDGVRVDSLYASYWVDHYVGAKRVRS